VSVSVRELTAEEARLLTAARLVAVEHAPYLAHALFATRAVAAEGLETFAVDRDWRLYLDPFRLAGWGPGLAGGVLVHEVGHLVRAHAERADALGADRDHERWAIAADLSINDDLLMAGIPLPTGAVTPAMFGLTEGGIEEAYYARRSPSARALRPVRRAGPPTRRAAAPARVSRRPPGSCQPTLRRPPPSAARRRR
jgi:predicted metal-dependent peptidase